MKKINTIILLLILISFTSFAENKKTINLEKLRPVPELDYKLCLIGTKTPFTGIAFNYFDNDNKILTEKISLTDGIYDGPVISYYKNGQEERVENYKFGIPDGKEIYYYKDGIMEHQGNYKNGEQDGEWIYHWPNGNLLTISNYKDGVSNGIYKSYYEDGYINEEINYLNGEINGLKNWYGYQGELILSENYVNGQLDGDTYHYADGEKTIKVVYKNGSEISLTVLENGFTISN